MSFRGSSFKVSCTNEFNLSFLCLITKYFYDYQVGCLIIVIKHPHIDVKIKLSVSLILTVLENDVILDIFCDLTRDPIKELIPKVGTSIKFLKKR